MAPDVLLGHVRTIPDYPVAGVSFRDITPLLGDPAAYRAVVDGLVDRFRDHDVTRVLGIEARGFILAGPVAVHLGAGFVPIRKPGKLPWAVVREEYDLEYGSDKLEMHRDAVHPGERVLVIDDVLATGGTAAAACRLVEALDGQVVGVGVVLELVDLGGRQRLGDRPVESLARV